MRVFPNGQYLGFRNVNYKLLLVQLGMWAMYVFSAIHVYYCECNKFLLPYILEFSQLHIVFICIFKHFL